MAKIISLCLFFVGFGFLFSGAQAASLRTQYQYLWLQQLEQQAIENGISPTIVYEALDTFSPNLRVVELDQKQPESIATFETYRRNTVAPTRIKKGAELMRLYKEELDAIEARTGVPPEIVVALWGIESNFGQNMGDFEVVNSLATLAYQGRRADFFRSELFAALHILERENMTSEELRGSWAGAMGQCQFMPSTYLKFAVDENGNGRRDIWNERTDVLASIANYLEAEGWKRPLTWGREAEIHTLSAANIDPAQKLPLQEWAAMGVTGIDGTPLPQREVQASLVQPDGEGGSGFLVYDNLRALMRWNHSTYFALSVGLLADGIKENQ
jgi:membrane-bound lytic murein transglycosylase B